MEYLDAVALVRAQCAADTAPTLSDAEVLALVDAQVDFTTWQATHAYAYGDVIQPVTRNGHQYRCIVGGTSGATEPTWPLYTAVDDTVGRTRPYWSGFTPPWPGAEVRDGTAVWIEAGADENGPLGKAEVKRATYNGWLQKAAKAGADFDVQTDGDTYNRSQVQAMCLTMAKQYRPMTVT